MMREQIIKDYEGILDFKRTTADNAIDLHIHSGFDVDGLIEELNSKYNLDCDYLLVCFDLRIFLEEKGE